MKEEGTAIAQQVSTLVHMYVQHTVASGAARKSERDKLIQ
jgi:hypothetical protein